MSNDSNTVANLIDLSTEDESCSPLQAAPPSNSSTFTPPLPLIPIFDFDGRESLENNPFDCIQKQANRPDDPFELLSREASYQPHSSETLAAANQAEVLIGNLLCMSDDSIKTEDEHLQPVLESVPEFSALQVPSSRFLEPICSVSSIGSTVNSSPCNDSAFTSRNESSKTINKAFITDNTISSFSEDSRAQSVMNKGFFGSCSSFDHSSTTSTPEGVVPPPQENSDSSGKGRSQKPADARKRLLKLSLSNSTSNSPLCRRPLDDDNSSPLSSVFSETENLADQFATRFGFDSGKSFDDSCDDLMSIKPNWIDSETDIDSDLEMMRIPILQEIPSPVIPNKATHWEQTIKIENPCTLPLSSKNSPDLEALKEKVQQHKAEKNNNHEIGTLIENLKKVIKDCANDTKKAEANNLLESLSNLMNDKSGCGTSDKTDTLTPPPQPIVRQGTFDIDLKENEEREERNKQEEGLQCEDEAHTDPNISTGTHSVHSVRSVQSPEADQSEVSDIVEQIGRLLSNQNVNVVQANLGTTVANGTMNPTYIVVMNTPIPPKVRPSINPMDHQNDGSPDLAHSQVRRRSQSLSIHDKEKSIVAPVPPSPLREDCKTPGRAPMVRRNSFSSATPSTPSIQINRRSMYGPGNTNDFASKQNQMPRRSMALETHHEKQQNAPQQNTTMAMGSISFNAKKLKFKQSTESIVTASGPMKATIPVKKVAPMIVTTNVDSPTEEPVNRFKSVTSTPNVQLNPSKYYPSACSTPMVEASPIKRSGLAKSRYSFIAATPTPKQSGLAPSSSQARRRTMSEMRSPKKVGDKPSTSGISKPGTVKTVKLPQNYSKTLNKMAPTTSKGVLRLSRPTSATGTADKNKENKLPRPGR